jgi:hypothetical protein
MKCVLVFDHLNDLIYSKCDARFAHHVKKLASIQGLISESEAKVRHVIFILALNEILMVLNYATIVEESWTVSAFKF